MATYKNEKMLLNAINYQIGIALDSTLQRLLDKLLEYIDENVYGWVSPSDNPWSPNRTFQFRESWQKIKPTIVGNMMVGEINQAIDVMQKTVIDGVMVHDDRDKLADIIETGIGYNFGHAEERQYFQPWLDWVDVNLENIFYEEMIKIELPVQRVGRI